MCCEGVISWDGQCGKKYTCPSASFRRQGFLDSVGGAWRLREPSAGTLLCIGFSMGGDLEL